MGVLEFIIALIVAFGSVFVLTTLIAVGFKDETIAIINAIKGKETINTEENIISKDEIET